MTPAPGAVPAEDTTVVTKLRDGRWHAVWQGAYRLLAEFDGTRDEAVAWARARSPRCWVYDEELGDVVLLEDDE
ncbi:hypothetical protein [Actinophytocola oryzae]|uniref:Uncharacterized protein n=1 Tax=Actinophytocola oryzae TaxID=502181 RepID=A0A4R7VN55_9PSEU|nr:hypothetical protein [Actinophytocola oryzae]TDV51066.1 hypothetical protein CLV71_106417 [Actinophytocola oryzae]